MYNITVGEIRSKKEYKAFLKRLEELSFAEKLTKDEENELYLLGLVVDDYESRNFEIGLPDPIEAIKIRMETLDLKQKDLVDCIGSEPRVSDILKKKRKLTIEMIRALSDFLTIPLEILIQDYELLTAKRRRLGSGGREPKLQMRAKT